MQHYFFGAQKKLSNSIYSFKILLLSYFPIMFNSYFVGEDSLYLCHLPTNTLFLFSKTVKELCSFLSSLNHTFYFTG